jgi:hypothetical protein
MRSVTLTEFGTEEGFSFMKNVHTHWPRSFGWADLSILICWGGTSADGCRLSGLVHDMWDATCAC